MIVDQKKTEWLSGITKSYHSFITPSHESKHTQHQQTTQKQPVNVALESFVDICHMVGPKMKMPQYCTKHIIRGNLGFGVWRLFCYLSLLPPINFHDIFDYSKPLRTPIPRGIVLWDIPTHLIHKT